MTPAQRRRTLRPMRRLLVLPLVVALLIPGGGALAQTPPAPAQGINVVPAPESPRRSEAGTLVEAGTVTPEEPVTDAVLVRSSFDEPREVLLYAADAQPAAGGGFGFSAREEKQEQVGQWLRLAQNRITVPADGEVRVSYTLTVPPGTQGGEYVGGIVAEPVEAAAGSGVQTRTRFAMAVYLRVPGGSADATPGRGSPGGKLVVEAVEPGFDGNGACPRVRYRNDSQDVVDPVARVTVDGLLGDSSYTEERVGAVLPDSSAEVQLPCIDRPVGPGRIVVELTSPRGGGRESATYTWAPWPFVLALLLLLLLIGALVTTFLRGFWRDRRAKGPATEPSADAPSQE